MFFFKKKSEEKPKITIIGIYQVCGPELEGIPCSENCVLFTSCSIRTEKEKTDNLVAEI